MTWELVTGMPLVPNACIACGQNPSDVEGNKKEALFAGGVDVGWGESVYICASCQNVIVQLVTGLTIEEVMGLKKELATSRREYQEEKKAHDKLQKRVKSMLKGARAKEKVTDGN